MSAVVDLNKRKRTPRALPLVDTSGAARFLRKMVRDIESDLGGKRELSRIESELVRAFAGAATTLQYLNVQVALGDTSAIDLAGYSTMASTMLRIGSRLGLSRRAKLVPDLDSFLAARAEAKQRPESST